MNDYDAASLWTAATHMAGGNPASALPNEKWSALQAHMMKWRDAQGTPMNHYNRDYQREFRRAWAELYLGRTP